jgi:SAM-dependent methyltransferase
VSFDFEADFFRSLLDQAGARPARLLIIGCGSGEEAGHIGEKVGARVVGVDLAVAPRWNRPGALLVRADARHLPFRDGAFEAIYCYHVLEHVPGPERAVREASRVLEPRGMALFGTPNKSRLIGYAGGRATAWEKVRWNLADYGKRITGRWDNARGAHAGFTGRELERMLAAAFPTVESVSLPYYLGKYPRLGGLWRTSFRVGLARFLAPSVYFRTARGAGPARSSNS